MSEDLREYMGLDGRELRVNAFAAADDALGGRLGVQFTIVDREIWVRLPQLGAERLRTRISMFLNADPEEFPRTLPYTYNRGEVDLHAQFLVEEGQMVIEVGGTPVILSRAQAEDLFEVLDMRINGDLDVAPGGGPRRVDVNGELVAE